MFTPKMIAIEANMSGRDFAVGDIHGSFDSLQRALEHISFDDSIDRLFSVGDLVNRGSQSHEVLTWLDYPWFHAICGNHELMTIRRAQGVPTIAPGVSDYPQPWFDSLSLDEQLKIATRLAALPLIMEIATATGPVGLVHADCPYDDWQEIRDATWSERDDHDATVDTCLWSIERYERRYTGIVHNIRAVIHGHVTIPVADKLGNVYYIDTGGWLTQGGQFSFVDLNTLEIVLGPGSPIVKVGRRYR